MTAWLSSIAEHLRHRQHLSSISDISRDLAPLQQLSSISKEHAQKAEKRHQPCQDHLVHAGVVSGPGLVAASVGPLAPS